MIYMGIEKEENSGRAVYFEEKDENIEKELKKMKLHLIMREEMEIGDILVIEVEGDQISTRIEGDNRCKK